MPRTPSDPPLLDGQLLGELADRWRAQAWPGLERLRSGLADDEIDAVTATFGLTLPLEARRWWGWHDGISVPPRSSDRDREFGGPGFVYLTLADAASEYAKMRRLATRLTADGFDEDELWHPMWFPVTRAAYGGVLACDCSDPTSDRTPIRAIEWETEMFGDIGARSFGELVTWWIDALDARAWHYDRDEARWRYEPTLLDPGRELTRLV